MSLFFASLFRRIVRFNFLIHKKSTTSTSYRDLFRQEKMPAVIKVKNIQHVGRYGRMFKTNGLPLIAQSLEEAKSITLAKTHHDVGPGVRNRLREYVLKFKFTKSYKLRSLLRKMEKEKRDIDKEVQAATTMREVNNLRKRLMSRIFKIHRLKKQLKKRAEAKLKEEKDLYVSSDDDNVQIVGRAEDLIIDEKDNVENIDSVQHSAHSDPAPLSFEAMLQDANNASMNPDPVTSPTPVPSIINEENVQSNALINLSDIPFLPDSVSSLMELNEFDLDFDTVEFDRLYNELDKLPATANPPARDSELTSSVDSLPVLVPFYEGYVPPVKQEDTVDFDELMEFSAEDLACLFDEDDEDANPIIFQV